MLGIFRGNIPDVTPAQTLAALLWAASQAVALGWINNVPSKITLMAAATLIAAAWKWADAHIRHGRAMAHIATPTTAPSAPVAPPTQ